MISLEKSNKNLDDFNATQLLTHTAVCRWFAQALPADYCTVVSYHNIRKNEELELLFYFFKQKVNIKAGVKEMEGYILEMKKGFDYMSMFFP